MKGYIILLIFCIIFWIIGFLNIDKYPEYKAFYYSVSLLGALLIVISFIFMVRKKHFFFFSSILIFFIFFSIFCILFFMPHLEKRRSTKKLVFDRLVDYPDRIFCTYNQRIPSLVFYLKQKVELIWGEEELMNKSISKFMALGILILAGCSTFTQSPTATLAPTDTPVPVLATSINDIVGTWQLGSGDHAVFFLFDEDGTFRTAQRVVTNLQDSPQQLGEFTMEGGLMTLVNSDESPYCDGQIGIYEAQLWEQGQISFIQQDDPCTFRAEYWMRGILDPFSP